MREKIIAEKESFPQESSPESDYDLSAVQLAVSRLLAPEGAALWGGHVADV